MRFSLCEYTDIMEFIMELYGVLYVEWYRNIKYCDSIKMK